MVVLGEFRAEGRDFGKEEFTFDTSSVGIVENGPYGYLGVSSDWGCFM